MLRLVAASAVAAGLLAAAPAADAAFTACGTNVSCETVTVPLDRSGQAPGTVDLAVRKVTASQTPGAGALFALAGGPGQAATPLVSSFAATLAPALRTRDLIVFDQRGTGLSGRLTCPSLGTLDPDAGTLACANSLGVRRAFYTSRDSADDIEAIRQTLGIDKISLYGVSYGTFVAETYARRYPQHVESLVLDSVINPAGRDPLDRSTYAAFPRVLKDICSGRKCKGITTNVTGILGKVVRALNRKELPTRLYDTDGHGRRVTIAPSDVKDMLEGADFDPTARAELPAVLTAARFGDGAPLARLYIREATTTGGSARFQAQQSAQDSDALYLATFCEETAFPWSRTAPLSSRPAALNAAVGALGPNAFAPWKGSIQLDDGSSTPCLGWTDGSATSPLVGGPLPDVPALLLEGVDDTRTPIADAQAAVSLLPQSHLVAVPETGHSVLGTDLGQCSSRAVSSFFGGQVVPACGPQERVFPPTPVPPRSFKKVKADKHTRGKRGKTITAVKAALNDAGAQATGFLLTGGDYAQGGLRGGVLRGSIEGRQLNITLHKVVFVPGVTISGHVSFALGNSGGKSSASVTVSGSQAAHGKLSLTPGHYKGKLDGKSVKAKLTAADASPLQLNRVPLSLDQIRQFRALARLRAPGF
jgi:pimeloyl-ACP methyl ester carboxylesterase